VLLCTRHGCSTCMPLCQRSLCHRFFRIFYIVVVVVFCLSMLNVALRKTLVLLCTWLKVKNKNNNNTAYCPLRSGRLISPGPGLVSQPWAGLLGLALVPRSWPWSPGSALVSWVHSGLLGPLWSPGPGLVSRAWPCLRGHYSVNVM